MNKKVKQDLFPDIPIEIRAARIGTCFNSISRKLMEKKIAIDPNRLKNGAVKFVDGKGKLQLKMNSTTEATTEGTFFSLDSKIKAEILSCSATVGFKTSLASQSVTNNSDLNCYCSYVYSGQELQLLNYGTKELYNSMTDEFQDAYSAVITSQNAKEYLANYMNFINLFGHGCVTDLYLTSGSAFTINVKYADQAEAIQRKYGGSFLLSTPWNVSGSAAAEFARDVSNTGSSATMDLLFEEIPQNTPTEAWCKRLMDSVSALGFEKLAKTPNAIQPYTGKEPEAPEIPEGTPTNKEEPLGKGFDITDDLKTAIMKEDKFKGTWAEYEIAQKIAYEELEAKKIVQEVQTSTQKPLSFINLMHTQQPERQIASALDVAVDDLWSLGGYCPFSYKITPWSDLFPQLKDMKLPTTFTSIYIAKMYIYYFTKLQFSSYLYFLADVGPEICQNDSIGIDAESYSKACKELFTVIQQRIEQNKTINEDLYKELINYFEVKVANLNAFYSKNVYQAFFNQYEFFIDNAYGFILQVGNQYVIVGGQVKDIPKPFSLVAMLKDACRIYPVICNDGTIVFASMEWNTWSRNYLEIVGGKEKNSEGFYYYKIKGIGSYYKTKGGNGQTLRFYGVGFQDIPQDVNLPVRGLPMFNPLPFEELKQFAKPRVVFSHKNIGRGEVINRNAIQGFIQIKGIQGPIRDSDVEVSYGGYTYPVYSHDLARPEGWFKQLALNTAFIVRVSAGAAATINIHVEWH